MHRNQKAVNSSGFLRNLFLEGEDVARCLGSLAKLARHIKAPVVLTGGIAIGWHLLRNGVERERGRLNDIDIVVEGLSDLHASLGRHFLIAHFHPSRERGKVLIQLVDEEHHTRVDVFTPPPTALLNRLTDAAIENLACRFVSAEDLLAKLLSIIYPATRNHPVEPKYVEHFRQLSTAAAADAMREVWREYRKEGQPVNFEAAAEAVKLSLEAHPDLLQPESYCQDINFTCPWCRRSELFPLAPRHRIYEALGYV
jgi:hypothetical protein